MCCHSNIFIKTMGSCLIVRSFFQSFRLGSNNPKFIQYWTILQNTVLFPFLLTYMIFKGWTSYSVLLMPLLSLSHLLEWKSPSINYLYASIMKIASMSHYSILSCVSLSILSNIAMYTLPLKTVWYPFLIGKPCDNFHRYDRFVYSQKECFHE